MSKENPSLAGNFESAAQTMLEALDKAGAELSANVSDCIEQLSSFNFGLQKSLQDQLHQVNERFQSFVESNSEELEKHKETLIQHLEEFERSQIESVFSAGQGVRNSLSAHAEDLFANVSQQVEGELAALKARVDEAEQRMATESGSALPELKASAASGKNKLESTANACEEEVATKAKDLEQKLTELIDEWKVSIESKVSESQVRFNNQAQTAIRECDEVLQGGLETMAKQAGESSLALDQSVSAGILRFDQEFHDWKSQVNTLSEGFSNALASKHKLSDEEATTLLEGNMSQVTLEVASVCQEAGEKIQGLHQTFHNSLHKLEQDSLRQLEHLLSRYESELSENSRKFNSIAILHSRNATDLQEKLDAQLMSQGGEMLRTINKLAEQLEVDCLKASQGVKERIESIRESTLEALEKQVQLMKAHSDKAVKAYLDSLLELETNSAQIEQAGKAAAVTVMAYRSAIG